MMDQEIRNHVVQDAIAMISQLMKEEGKGFREALVNAEVEYKLTQEEMDLVKKCEVLLGNQRNEGKT